MSQQVSSPQAGSDATRSTSGPGTDVVHVVVLLHGIRTRAFWYDLVQPILSEIEGTVVKPLGYDYFSALRLVFPLFRSGPARKIADDIRDIKARYDQQNKRVRISVIAHSFGTYTIARLLRQTGDIDLHHLVLCGSVLPNNFNFDSISRKIRGKFVNDAGARDAWPVLAKISSFGYGVSGTFGFQSGLIEDRFHDFAHSDFFNKEFIRTYWFPIFDRDQVNHSSYERKPSWRTRLINLLALAPPGILLIGLVAAALYLAVPPLYTTYKETVVSMLINQIDKERLKVKPLAPPPVVLSAPRSTETVASDDEILTRILKWEGGYVASPDPAVGPTSAGISIAQWQTYSGKPANADTIKNLTPSQVMDFYRDSFLQRPGVQGIKNPAVRGAYANMVAMSGQSQATKAFQTALKLPVDGSLGPLTVASINDVASPDLLIESASCSLLDALKSGPLFATFGKAWTRRVEDFLPKDLKGVCPGYFQ